MSGPADESTVPENLTDLPDDVRESIEDERDPSYGDETQRNEVIETEEGMEQDSFIEPEDEGDEEEPREHPRL